MPANSTLFRKETFQCTSTVLAKTGFASVFPSHVLVAMGYKPERVDSSIRISFNNENTMEEAESFCNALFDIAQINKKIRRL